MANPTKEQIGDPVDKAELDAAWSKVMSSNLRASCGHALPSMNAAFAVEYRSEDCDAVQGFVPCVVYATYCSACTLELVSDENFISARSLAEDTNTVGRQQPSKLHDAGSSPAGHAISNAVENLRRATSIGWRENDPQSMNLAIEKLLKGVGTVIDQLESLPVETDGWQPIETAPLEGAHVLVVDDEQVSEARHIEGHGWYLAQNDPTDSWGPGPLNPTHWMPLPCPPGTRSPPSSPEEPSGLKAAVVTNECTHEFRPIDSSGQRVCIYCNVRQEKASGESRSEFERDRGFVPRDEQGRPK